MQANRIAGLPWTADTMKWPMLGTGSTQYGQQMRYFVHFANANLSWGFELGLASSYYSNCDQHKNRHDTAMIPGSRHRRTGRTRQTRWGQRYPGIKASWHRASDDAPLEIKRTNMPVLSLLRCSGRRDAYYGMHAWTHTSRPYSADISACVDAGVDVD